MGEWLTRLVLIPFMGAVWIGATLYDRWRRRWRARAESVDARVLTAIREGHNYGFDIGRATGLGAGSTYVSLYRLEQSGRITSRWEDDPGDRPRRRLYTAVTGRTVTSG